VATTLSVSVIPDLSQGSYYLAPGDTRQDAHTRTSTNSSEIDGGIGSSCAEDYNRDARPPPHMSGPVCVNKALGRSINGEGCISRRNPATCLGSRHYVGPAPNCIYPSRNER
jgi:hypothetical protein